VRWATYRRAACELAAFVVILGAVFAAFLIATRLGPDLVACESDGGVYDHGACLPRVDDGGRR